MTRAQGARGGPLVLLPVLFLTALAMFTLILALVSLPVGTYAFFYTKITNNYTTSSLVHPYLWLGPYPQFLPFATSLGAYFAFFIVAYSGFFLYALRTGSGLGRALSSALGSEVGRLLSNDLLATILSIGFLTFTAVKIDDFVGALGVPICGLSGDSMLLFAGFTAAPLTEEIGFRVMIVGLASAAIALAVGRRQAFRALWRPSAAYDELQGGSAARIAVWSAAGVSAVVFGLAHVSSGSGWCVGKLPEAVWGGAVLGYVYIKYGLHAAVLTHWGIDYLGTAFAFYGQGAFGIPWTAEPGYFLQSLLTTDLAQMFGLACLFLALYLAVGRIRPEVSPKLTVEGLKAVP